MPCCVRSSFCVPRRVADDHDCRDDDPVAVLGAVACLYGMEQTINLMTLAGLALAIGPLVDSAIICLENTHRHLGLGANPIEAAYLGASEVVCRN